jgi:hypothetical protein
MIYLPGRQQARRKFEAIESELSYLLLQILSQYPSIRAVCRWLSCHHWYNTAHLNNIFKT